MKHLFFLFLFSIIAVNAAEILYEDERFTLYTPSAERITTNTLNRTKTTHKIEKFDLNELNANTIQMSYYGPLKSQSSVEIIMPQYINGINMMFPSRKTLATLITGASIRKLYSAILNESEDLPYIVYNIFKESNGSYANYILYGKDKFGRNVAYIYNLGKENKGIVFFYPDNFSAVFKQLYKSPFNYGWPIFIDNFINIISEYNQHIKIEKSIKGNEIIYIISYR